MTDFEKQLIKAIEHGCPECGGRPELWCIEERGYALGIDQTRTSIYYEERGCFSSSKNNEVECQDCGFSFWIAETGWIPELQEIVKGE